MLSQRTIFRRGPASGRSLILLLILGLAMVGVSVFTPWLQPVRAAFLDFIAPFYRITNVADSLSEWGEGSLASKEELIAERQKLRDENLILRRRVMQMSSLRAENARLRQLLSAAEVVEERVLIAEVVGVPPDTETHRLIINRGALEEVTVGQPVLDAQGIFGQVILAGEQHSEIILISDRDHALPAEVLRSGARVIAEGTGQYSELRLRNIPPTLDLRKGDQLVSSGMGGKFPPGYPIGEVKSIEKNDASPFVDVRVEPSASLTTGRQLLLLFSQSDSLRSTQEADIELPAEDEPDQEESTGPVN